MDPSKADISAIPPFEASSNKMVWDFPVSFITDSPLADKVSAVDAKHKTEQQKTAMHRSLARLRGIRQESRRCSGCSPLVFGARLCFHCVYGCFSAHRVVTNISLYFNFLVDMMLIYPYKRSHVYNGNHFEIQEPGVSMCAAA
jgi:hypothetical protein